MDDVTRGQAVVVRTATGESLAKRAVSGVEPGHDFPIVWVCREEEWQSAEAERREPDAVPWPAEDVTPVERVNA